jgi:hypothetical protein
MACSRWQVPEIKIDQPSILSHLADGTVMNSAKELVGV